MKKLFIAAFAVLAFASCSTIRYVAEDYQVEQPESIAIAEPLVAIDVLFDKGGEEFSDSLTVMALNATNVAIEEALGAPPISEVLPVKDEVFGELYAAIQYLTKTDLSKKEIKAMYPPKVVLDYMKENNLKRAGFLIESGFERTSDNYKKAALISAATTILTAALTLGRSVYIGSPRKYMDIYSFVVVDAEQQRIVFRNTLSREQHTFDVNSSRSMIRNLFDDYRHSMVKGSK